jgi:septum formation protein
LGTTAPLILASASAIRAELLRRAGLSFDVENAAIDEAEIKASFRAAGHEAAECAAALAEAKASWVARRHPGILVIGADQMLVCDNSWFDKPASLGEAALHLRALRGRRHELVTAACICRDGQRLWHIVERPALTMRAFSEAFLAAYLEHSGSDLLGSVGAYRLEEGGVQLFSRIDGDYFSILGLPLLPLLEFLRGHGVVER